ncbi:MAG: repressor LexA [Bacteroidetes bacterium]|nr:repressor LexA [Bacteroidota bacterium]
MENKPLTKAQQKVLNLVKAYIEENNIPPTLAELADQLKVNLNAVRSHLLTLDRKRAIKYIPNISRGIELINPRPKGIPIYGYVPAGTPFMSQENIVDTFEIKKYISASEEVFGLYVRGDSMKDANLETDDLLFVDPKVEARNGRMVVAMVEGEPTVKWYERDGNNIRLVPANSKYKPIEVNRHDDRFRIVGVVVGMIRSIDKKRIDDAVKYKKAS